MSDIIEYNGKQISRSELTSLHCNTKEDLHNWIKAFLNIDFPDCTVSETSNSNPTDMIWWIYQNCVSKQQLMPQKALFIANRSGYKTLGMSVAELLTIFHGHRDVAHLGAIEMQATRCYNYFVKYLNDEAFKEALKKPPTMGKTEFKFDSTLEILPCTIASVNGPHTSFVCLDETDVVRDIAAYRDISGIPSKTKDGFGPVQVSISTMKTLYGLVAQEMADAEKTNTKVFIWNIIDLTERCPDERSGTEEIDIYVNQHTLEAVSTEEIQKRPLTEQTKFEKRKGCDGCLKNCKIFAACLGDLKKQKSKSSLLHSIDYAQNEILSRPSDWTIAQLLCRKPSTEGIIYFTYGQRDHVKTYNQMYEIFTGEQYTGDVTFDTLHNEFTSRGVYPYVGVDFGDQMAVALLIYFDGADRAYVLREQVFVGSDDNEVALWIKQNWGHLQIQMAYPDVANPSGWKLLLKQDIPVSQKVDKDVHAGINTVRRFLRIPGTNKAKIFIHESCGNLIWEFPRYHYKKTPNNQFTNQPDKINDHCFTEGHEILTQTGWKEFQDLTYSDMVAAVTPLKKIIFERPQEIICQNYKGKIYNIKTSSSSFFDITPNHNVAHITQYSLKRKKDYTIQLQPIKNFNYKELYIPLSAKINRKSTYKQPFLELGLSNVEWSYLLGIYLAEGCSNVNYNHHRVHIYQKKPIIINKILSIMQKIQLNVPIQHWVDNKGVHVWEFQRKKYWDYFQQFGKCDQKYIPQDFLRCADADMINAIISGLMDGDGSIMGTNNDFSTTSLQLANDFSYAATLVGHSTHLKGPYIPLQHKHRKASYKVRLNKRKNYPTLHIKRRNITTTNYNGKIYCVSTSTGMIMVRHKGFSFISGNSLDALRYVLHTKYNTQALVFTSVAPPGSLLATSDETVMASDKKSYLKVPNASDVAKQLGIPFNDNRQQVAQKPQVVEINKKSSESGGFSWTWGEDK